VILVAVAWLAAAFGRGDCTGLMLSLNVGLGGWVVVCGERRVGQLM